MNYGYIIVTIVLFSTLEIAGKLIGTNISPAAVTIYRFMTGGILLLPFAISKMKQNQISLKRKGLLRMLLLGFINVTVSMLFLQYAIYYGKASIVAILISTNPLFAAIFAKIFLKQDFTLRKLIGMIIGIAGVVLIIVSESDHTPANVINNNLGIFFALIASVTFGLYTALSMKYVDNYGNTITNAFAFIFGSIILLIISIIFGWKITFNASIENISIIAYLGIFVTGLGYLSYFQGLKHISASVGSMFFFLKPVITSILAYIFFGENLHNMQYMGFFVVLVGLRYDSFITSHRKLQIRFK